MRVERIQARAAARVLAPDAPGLRRRAVARGLLALLAALAALLLARPAASDEAPSPSADATAAAAPSDTSTGATPASEPRVRVTGSLTTRATVQGGRGNDDLSTRLGLEWLAGSWDGGFSLEMSNDRDGSLGGRDDVGSFDLSERWVGWRSRGARPVELRLGTARGIQFGQGLILGSPTFDGLELIADVTRRQRTIVVAGRTESIDPEDLVEDPLGLFPSDEPLGENGRLAGVRHEVQAGSGLVGVNLLRASADGAPVSGLGSVDWAFTRGMVDFASEVAVLRGGYGATARTTISPSAAWGVTVEGRRYQDFLSPLDTAPRYEGLSASDEHDETGGLVRFDVAPHERFSGSVSFDYSQGGSAASAKAGVRRDARLVLRWAVRERTSLTYGFELEDLSTGRDGRVHSLLVVHSFERFGRLSARFAFDRATADPRDSLRASWRMPLRGRKLTLLVDAALRREKDLTRELQAGLSLRMGASSFLTVRGTVADDETESVDVTWYRRF